VNKREEMAREEEMEELECLLIRVAWERLEVLVELVVFAHMVGLLGTILEPFNHRMRR